ncbi:dienelactone hydrolase family protein [Candidatus Blastococcus massiliensis]|uniref:dienelactone hydrolase family protein n=1 Tax=Candidatus Blastococcus massiliensis TaxID=1470358 RepID=UPI0004B4C821|nr:dienelactone hydrolase family protein [Candidatus Blastococcus massiliensis]
MAEVLLFHHAQGLTDGLLALADDIRAGGHVVHTPDLFDGATYATLDEGMNHVRRLGFGTVVDLGRQVAETLPRHVVYAGASLGVMPAQALAQNRPGARGALFLHGCAPPSEFGGSWPPGLPVQLHTTQDDEWGDLDVARALAAEVDSAELFVYPGDAHLFTDRSLPDHDAEAAALVLRRVMDFLASLDLRE